jgi:hypothetical protein
MLYCPDSTNIQQTSPYIELEKITPPKALILHKTSTVAMKWK